MTKRIGGLALCLTALVMLGGCDKGGAQPGATQGTGTGLDATFMPLNGDVIAERAVGRLRLKGALNAPMSAHYDRKQKVIVIDVGGARDKIEECKETIDKIRSVLLTEIKPLISQELGVEISENDFDVVYTNRDTGKEIVRMERGKWLLAGP